MMGTYFWQLRKVVLDGKVPNCGKMEIGNHGRHFDLDLGIFVISMKGMSVTQT